MPFSSLEFISLLPAGIAIYWLLRARLAQRAFVIFVTSLFVAFTSLFHLWVFWGVVAATVLLVSVANLLPALGRWLLAVGVSGLIVTLAYYKVTPPHPLGISYYSFVLIGFLLDGLGGARLNAARIVPMVVFFPMVLAGPIVRWRAWAPQFGRRRKTRVAHNVTIGTQLLGIGALKKILIADAIATSTAPIWVDPFAYTRPAIALAIVAFYLQVYADFSGYTDMARGVARMMGFRLPINFRGPYLAATPLEFWSRWHMSLTSWIRDYVFTPLSIQLWRRVRSPRLAPVVTFVLVVTLMTLVGLWHGATWSFLVFGALHGVLIGVWYLAVGTGRRMAGSRRLVSAVLFQLALMVSMVLFRSDSVSGAANMLEAAVTSSGTFSLADAGVGLAIAAMFVFLAQAIELRAGRPTLARRLVSLRRDRRLFPMFVVFALAVFYMKGLTLEGVWIPPSDPFFNLGQEKFIYFAF